MTAEATLVEYDLKSRLRQHLEGIKKRNPRFSLRSLAKKIQVNPTSLSLFLNGKRDLSIATCQRLLAEMESQSFLTPISDQESLAEFVRSKHIHVAASDHDNIKLMSHWLPTALLSHFETKNASQEARVIAKRLQVPVAQVRNDIALLCRLGLLKEGKSKTLVATGKSLSMGSLEPSRYIRKSQLQFYDRSRWIQEQLEKGLESSLPFNFSMTVTPANPSQIAKVKQEIMRFRRRMEKILATGEKSEVYILAVDLLPITAQFSQSNKIPSTSSAKK